MNQLLNLTPEQIKAYQDQIQANHAPKTVIRHTSSLRRFFKWAQKEGHVSTNPFESPSLPRSQETPPGGYLSESGKSSSFPRLLKVFSLGIGAIATVVLAVLVYQYLPTDKNNKQEIPAPQPQSQPLPQPTQTLPVSPGLPQSLESAHISSLSVKTITMLGQNPTIHADDGSLGIESNATTLTTSATSDGNITLSPDGNGSVAIRSSTTDNNSLDIQNANLGSGDLIHGHVGNNASGYNLLYLSSGASPIERFSVDAKGNTYTGGSQTVTGQTTTSSLSTNQINLNGNLAIAGVTRLNSFGRLASITGYYQDSGLFAIDQGSPDSARITKSPSKDQGPASADVLTLTLDETNTTASAYDTLVLERTNAATNGYALNVRSGDTNLAGNITVGGDITASSGTLNIGGALTVSGATTLSSTLTVSGATTLSSTLGVTGASTFSGRPTFTKAPTSAHTGTWAIGSSTWNQSDATIYINPASATADSNLLGLAVGGSVVFDVDAEGDIYGKSLILTGSVSEGTTTITGDLSVEGNTTLGDATTDTLTVNVATLTWAGGDKTIDLTGATTRTLTLLNSTASQVTNLDLSDGSLYTGGTQRLTNAGALTNITGISSSGTITLSGLTVSRAVFTDSSSNLTTTAASSALSSSLSDETGTGGVAVFSTAPSVTALTVSSGNLGVNTSINAAYAVNIGGSSLSGTTQIGLLSAPTYSSSATSEGVGLYVQPATAASSFTLTTATGLRIDNTSEGAGSAITTMRGIYVNSMTAGSTSNYGIYVDAPSGGSTNTAGYFGGKVDIAQGTASSIGLQLTQSGSVVNNNDNAALYVLDQQTGGTAFRVRSDAASAASYFAHILLNSTTASAPALTVDNLGTGNSFVVNDQGSDTTPFVIDNAGQVGVGTGTPGSALDVIGASRASTYFAGSSGNTNLRATGTASGNGNTASIYFQNSSGTTKGRVDTTNTQTVGGTGNDGACSVSGSTNVQTGSCAGRATADAIATAISSTAAAGSNAITVASCSGINGGDEVILIQMVGTGAGNFESKTVSSCNSTTLNLTASTTNAYTNDGSSEPQVVRVPQYTTVTVNSGGTMTVSAWNGTTGGVLFFRASTSVTVSSGGIIDLNGTGLGGGAGGSAGSGGAGGDEAGSNGTVGSAGSAGSTGTGSGAGGGGSTAGAGGPGGVGQAQGGGGGSGMGGPGGGGSYGSAGTSNNGASANGGAGGRNTAFAAGAAGTGGSAGSTYGAAALTTIFAGSGGGGGAGGYGGGGGAGVNGGLASNRGGAGGAGSAGAAGGTGGGILYVGTPTYTNSGTVRANGSAGSTASTATAGTGCGAGNCHSGGGGAGGSGGGGGAGGSIFIQATTATLGTTTATGGSGGTAGAGGAGGSGGCCDGDAGGGGGAGSTGGAAGTNAGPTGSAPGAGSSGAATGGTGGDGRVRVEGTTISGSSSPTASTSSTQATINNGANSYGTLYIGSVNTSSADLAEYYVTGDKTINEGDVVTISNTRVLGDNSEEVVTQGALRKSLASYDQKLIGIISTEPGLTLGSIDGDSGTHDKRVLALSGRVPVKVNGEGGPIHIGDYLTSSSTPGVAMKATRPGPVVAIALENYEESEVAKINGFVHLGFADPQQTLRQLALDTDGSLLLPSLKIKTAQTALGGIADTESQSYITIDVVEKIKDFEAKFAAFGGLAQNFIGNLQSTLITTTEIIADTLTAKQINTDKIVSPIIEADEIKTRNLNAETAHIDQATISGVLVADEIIANKIKANQIEGVQVVVEELIASQTATQTLSFNKAYTTQKSVIDTLRDRLDSLNDQITTIHAQSQTYQQIEKVLDKTASSSAMVEFADSWTTDPASASAMLADLSLTGNFNVLGDINVFGTTRLADTYVSGMVTINSPDSSQGLFLGSNTISAFGGALQLIASDGVDIMSGAFIVDGLGSVHVRGDLSVGGTLTAQAVVTDTLEASDSATVKKLIIASDSTQVELAAEGEVNSNATAGKSILPAGQINITIHNPTVTDQTLVYITPNGPTNNQVLYVSAKQSGSSFTVSIDQPILSDVEFNWWIIDLKP